MPPEYPVEQLMIDMMSAFRENAVYIVPCALLAAAVAFIVAWFMDSIDIAGKSFGRHR